MSDDGYNDEFSDGEGQNEGPPADYQDEQQAQKVNGMIEALQMKVDELQLELAAEKAKSESLQKNKSYDRAVAEVDYYKSMVETLNEKLALATTDTTDACPPRLQQEFFAYCKRNKIFPDWTERDMNVSNCVRILWTKVSNSDIQTDTSKMVFDNHSTSVSGGSEHHMIRRIKELENELQLALGAAEDIRALKAKLLQMVERNRQEKEQRLRTELDLQHSKKKVEMLSDHMEKLMVHLKHESASKLRVVEQLRASEKENAKIKEKCDLVIRKGAAKDRLILELREGSKVLEDQLRLMDEKFLELRTKLDWARELGAKKIRKAEQKAKELRAKFALAGNLTLLDNVQLPDIRSGSGGYDNSAGSGYDEPASWSAKGRGRNFGGLNSKSLNNSSEHQQGLFRSNTSSDISDIDSKKPEPNINVVLEKIRKQQGIKQEWTDEKLRQLTQKKI